tara:strand:- start:194 stop:379 length:186 start_codon:yes stop_codon:yes gene_type:complete
MVENIVYGAGGIPMVKQPNEVAPVEKTAAPKKEKKKNLQEIYGEGENDNTDGFDEEHGDDK